MPEANERVLGIMAVIAQAERKMISTRIRLALAEARKRVAVSATLMTVPRRQGKSWQRG
jgi:DNA invertase Pin-like site-specific DNA recombinase